MPVSAAITKTSGDLDLAMITKNIKTTWRQEAITKDVLPWTMERWDEYGGMFVTLPGGKVGKRYCLVVNTAHRRLGALHRLGRHLLDPHARRYVLRHAGRHCSAGRSRRQRRWRAVRRHHGRRLGDVSVAIADRGVAARRGPSLTSKANASSAAATVGLHRLRRSISRRRRRPIVDPGVLDVWDQGLWDQAKWDQDVAVFSVVHNTGWVSIGLTGYSHAPVVQITMNQRAKPDVELINISATMNGAASTSRRGP